MYGQFSGIGSVITQVVANADTGGYDGQVCNIIIQGCEVGRLTATTHSSGPVSEFFQLVPCTTNRTIEPYELVC